MKKFETIEELTLDPLFGEHLASELEALKRKRRNRPSAPNGLRYRRDWYDRMTDDGTLTYEFFAKEALPVLTNRSWLCKQCREVVRHVAEQAAARTLKAYEDGALS